MFINNIYGQLTVSDLPIVVINTKGQTIANEPKINAIMKIIYHGGGIKNLISDQEYYYNNAIGIELRGNSSQNFPQKQYGIETRDSITGANLDVPLFGFPADNDWVLYAPYNDVSLVRNTLAYHIWNRMDHWGPRIKYCELVLNGEYQGVYILLESIKRGKGRVDVSKLEAKDTTGVNLTGGYIMKIDKVNNSLDKNFVSVVKSIENQNVSWLYHYPKPENIQKSQEDYIRKYIDTVETLIQSSSFSDPIVGYRKYLSMGSFIDYLLLNELTRNTDAYKASAYFHKEKRDKDGSKGKFKAGPVWDYNFGFGNASFCSGGLYTDFMYKGCSPATLPMPRMWLRLMQDSSFASEVKCRYTELRNSLLNEDYINQFIDSYANDTLKEAQVRHFDKWKILGTNPGGFNAYVSQTYAQEIQTLKAWIKDRLVWMDANLPGNCMVSSIDESTLEKSISTIFPNPNTGDFEFQIEGDVENVHLMDVSGKFIQIKVVRQSKSSYKVNTMSITKSGMYFLKVVCDGRTYNNKISIN